MAETSNPAAPATNDEFTITRTFDSPPERVFAAWTEPERLKRWFGPKGVTMPVCTMDLRPGGTFHYGMRTAEGYDMWGKWVFREIAPPGRLVAVTSFANATGGVSRHPLSPTWPLQTLATTTFEAASDARTTITVRWSPHEATPEERRTFAASHDAMRQGWTGTFDQLVAYLKEDVLEQRA